MTGILTGQEALDEAVRRSSELEAQAAGGAEAAKLREQLQQEAALAARAEEVRSRWPAPLLLSPEP